MKTRAQIYSHEASGILRDISTYGVLTQKQILGLYPQKDEQLKNLLSYLCKQKRLFLVDGFYSRHRSCRKTATVVWKQR